MTAPTITYGGEVTRRTRPHGIDLAVIRISLAMLLWARKRSQRTMLTHDEYARVVCEAGENARRQHRAALMLARVI